MLLHPREDVGNHDGFEARFATPIAVGCPAEAQRVGRFRFYVDGQRWEWSENVERLHGYEPGTVNPTTDLVLGHTHPDDWQRVRRRTGQSGGRRARSAVAIASSTPQDGRTGSSWSATAFSTMQATSSAPSGFYVDITETMESDISTALSKVTEARAEIEQAKGLLMAAYGISADQAFDILVWRSQETNVKVRKLAHRFINAMAGRLPADTRRQVDRALLDIS